jgi:hypothetical protein
MGIFQGSDPSSLTSCPLIPDLCLFTPLCA